MAKPTSDFEEQLQQIDKALSVDCVSPILSAKNPDVVGVKSHMDKNKFTPDQVSHLSENVCGPDLHSFGVGFSGTKSKIRSWTRKGIRPNKSNFKHLMVEYSTKRKSPKRDFTESMDKKIKLEEETRKLGLLMETKLGWAEVAQQPCQKQ